MKWFWFCSKYLWGFFSASQALIFSNIQNRDIFLYYMHKPYFIWKTGLHSKRMMFKLMKISLNMKATGKKEKCWFSLSVRSGADCFQSWEKCQFHAAKRPLHNPFIPQWSCSPLPSSRQELRRAATGRHSQILHLAISPSLSEQPAWRIWLKDIFSFVPAEEMKKLFSD